MKLIQRELNKIAKLLKAGIKIKDEASAGKILSDLKTFPPLMGVNAKDSNASLYEVSFPLGNVLSDISYYSNGKMDKDELEKETKKEREKIKTIAKAMENNSKIMKKLTTLLDKIF